MPTKISLEEAKSHGIEPCFDLMENGERKYRLNSSDGTSYCRTEASNQGAWQNSHYHKWMTEFYVVQSGWIVFAEYNPDSGCTLRLLERGETVTVLPLVPHNLYMSARSVIHTIKYGEQPTEIDWFSAPELDSNTTNLSEAEMTKYLLR